MRKTTDSGVASPRTLPLPQSPTPNTQRTMTPVSSRTHPISHSVSQSADSASYYVDGSIDQASPVRSHDFATGKRPDMQSPSSPKSQHSYLNGQYDYERAAGPFTPSNHHNETNANSIRVSDSSSMFGTLPSRTLLESVQPPFSVDGVDKEGNAHGQGDGVGIPGSYHDTPRLSKTGEASEKRNPKETSYFNAEDELKKTNKGTQGDDVSIGEAF